VRSLTESILQPGGTVIRLLLLVRSRFVQGVRVRFIAAGSASCHSIIGDANGLCYTWGRNEVRQGLRECYIGAEAVQASGCVQSFNPACHWESHTGAISKKPRIACVHWAAPSEPHRIAAFKLAPKPHTSPPPVMLSCPSCPSMCVCCTQKGQLGTGDLFQRNMPTVVEGLRGKKVVGASAGRHHSVVYTSTGRAARRVRTARKLQASSALYVCRS
jgi:hypothetical protein